jgi:endoglucanase
MKRRRFLQTTALAAVATATAPQVTLLASPAKPTAARLPRWRGFNLLQKFHARPEGNPPFAEDEFALIAEWGFDFVRLPLSYRCWASPDEPLKLREPELKHVDQAIAFGQRHQVHVNVNLHRAPGYCVNAPKEPLDLWTDEKALDACAFHWAHFAKRFKGIPNDQVSFDLINEPANVSEEAYARVVRRLVQAIRAEDPDRLIIADGLRWGRDPVPSLVDLRIGQSTRGYDPIEISHYQAGWIEGSDKWPVPTWPLEAHGQTFDKAFLKKDRIAPWQALERRGVGVHVGEWGAHNRTPHAVALAWMRDCLDLWKAAGWGWALWNLGGSFGVLDSERADVKYEDFRGHKLDREMLKLLQAG